MFTSLKPTKSRFRSFTCKQNFIDWKPETVNFSIWKGAWVSGCSLKDKIFKMLLWKKTLKLVVKQIVLFLSIYLVHSFKHITFFVSSPRSFSVLTLVVLQQNHFKFFIKKTSYLLCVLTLLFTVLGWNLTGYWKLHMLIKTFFQFILDNLFSELLTWGDGKPLFWMNSTVFLPEAVFKS